MDYEPVTPSRPSQPAGFEPSRAGKDSGLPEPRVRDASAAPKPGRKSPVADAGEAETWSAKRGHALSYAGLLLFTVVLYFRPSDFFPSATFLLRLPFWIALATLIAYVPTQMGLDGTLSAKTRELKYILLLGLMAIIAVVLATDKNEAWNTFYDQLSKVIIMFVVMMNVIRTERRLRWVILVVLAASIYYAVGALSDYRLGNLTVGGYRVEGMGTGMLNNTNEAALHLAIMVPLAAALVFSARTLAGKLVYGLSAGVMTAAIFVSYSRGAFLGLVISALVMIWKIGRRNKFGVVLVSVLLVCSFVAVAPPGFAVRIASIFIPGLDAHGSSEARQAILTRSVHVAIRHPLFGVGPGNFPIYSLHDKVSHNAFTQVASEIGFPALYFYVMFMIVPLRKLRRIERETYKARPAARFFYMSVGLQACLVSYMVSSFFGSVAYQWHVYYLVGYAVCLRRLYYTAPDLPRVAEGGGQEAGRGLPGASRGQLEPATSVKL